MTFSWQIPDLKDLEIDTEEEEEVEVKEAAAEVSVQPVPVMKMLDISQVKLRETKPAPASRPKTEGEKKVVPSWMEELSKKQANRRSVGIFLDQESKMEIQKEAPKSSPIISRYFCLEDFFKV